MQITDPMLSHAEWQAVSIALSDADLHGCPAPDMGGPVRAGMARLRLLLTGTEPPRPLADARLEAIRRFVCATRRGRAAADHAAALIAQGFSPRQIDALALLAA